MGASEPGAVVFLHGVGLDPELFDHVLDLMDRPTIAPLRDPYLPGAAAPGPVEQQARDVLERLDEWGRAAGDSGGAVTLVGVSGGATIALAAAIELGHGAPSTRPVDSVVAHEPLVGPLAPELHGRVADAAEQLAAAAGARGAEDFVGGLVGDVAWNALPAAARRFVGDHEVIVRREVERFAAFAPAPDDLSAIATPVTVTTGCLSAPARHIAAGVLVRRAGARGVTVRGAGHLVHRDAPAAFAAIVERGVGSR